MTVAVSGDSITFPDNSVQATAPKVGMVNRIINGAMVIDQRNAGASVTPANGQYITDRWVYSSFTSGKITAQQSAVAPAGFTNSLLITSASAYSVPAGEYYVAQQRIEGFNTADLAWGSANASSVALSFWVRSSLTGTFGGSLSNNAFNRSYPFSFTINTANTWEQKTITVAGDTTGTWLTNKGIGMYVTFNLGSGSTFQGTAGAWAGSQFTAPTGAVSVVGTSGATFYITGVQLEKGSTATSFDYRPYGTELGLCQRYAFRHNATIGLVVAASWTGGASVRMPVTMRAQPTASNMAFTANTGSAGTPAVLVYGGTDGNSVLIYNTAVNWSISATINLDALFSAEL